MSLCLCVKNDPVQLPNLGLCLLSQSEQGNPPRKTNPRLAKGIARHLSGDGRNGQNNGRNHIHLVTALRRLTRQAEALVGKRRRDTALRRTVEVTFHDQERFVGLLDRVRLLADGDGDRRQTDRWRNPTAGVGVVASSVLECRHGVADPSACWSDV